MQESWKLDKALHNKIYQQIERDVFGQAKPVDNPRVIITSGQPGSGKSKLLELSRTMFPDGNVVVINGDDLRNFHPRTEEILKLDDKKFAENTDPDSREWTRKLFDRAIETKRNIVFESTMREAGPISQTLERLRSQGYHITAKVVATSERASTTAIFRRYEEQKAVKGFGRWSQLSSHDAGYTGMPKTVEYIEKQGLVDRLEVYNRSGGLLYDNNCKGGKWEKEPGAVSAIESERLRQPTERERAEFQSDWQRIYDLMDERQAPAKERELARSTYEKLERELNKASAPIPPKEATGLRKKMQRLKETQKEPSREDDLLNK